MGLFDKLKGMVTTTTEDNDDFYPEVESDEELSMPPARTGAQPVQQTPAATAMDIAAEPTAAVEMRVVRPDSYAGVTEIADHLLNHRTVVLNLEATNKEVAKRLIDFLAGVAYSIDGHLKKISNNTYIITPCNVGVEDSQVKAADLSRQAATQSAPTVSFTPSESLF